MMKENLKEDKFISERDLERILDERLSKLDLIDNNHRKESEKHPHKPLHLEHKPKKHERLMINLDEEFETLIDIFGDEFTAEAVIRSLKESPNEIQIIAKIIMKLYENIEVIYGEWL